MGGALARAVLRSGDADVYLSDTRAEAMLSLSSEYGARISDNLKIAETCDIIFIAVKPNAYSAVLEPLREAFSKNKDSVIVSIAAGITTERVKELCGEHKIIRIMPNTPASIGRGVILWCKNDMVTDTDVKALECALSEAGFLDHLDERLFDAASAVSGCGPAFVYMFIEGLADGAVQCGLPRDKAMLYAARTLIGASELLLSTGKHPGALKDEVCSPGGSTIEGVHALEEGAFRSDAANAVIRAFEKTKMLGK